jgi:hypothetical protein
MPTTQQQSSINALCPHTFYQCSDLPNLSRIGKFSCSKCDEWRNRMHLGRRDNRDRSQLKFYECSRVKKGMGGIRMRVICGNETETLLRIGAAAEDTISSIKSKEEMQNVIGVATNDTTSSSTVEKVMQKAQSVVATRAKCPKKKKKNRAK